MKDFVFVRPILALACALALAGGCGKSSDHGHAHGPGGHTHPHEGDEEKTGQITAWNERYEIFAEHQAPVAGQAATFITHVSDVQTGEPRTNGPIRFDFSQPATGANFAHPDPSPERPGIYLPAITFPTAGEWKITLAIPGDNAATIDLGTIRVYPTAADARKAEFPEPPEGISFLKEQQWRIRARTLPATRRTLNKTLPLHATVLPGPGSKALVHSTVTGTLLAGDGAPRLGSPVKAGDIIAWVLPAFGEFTTKLVQAEADAIRAKASFDQAQTFYERTKRLFEQQAKSQRELQEAEVAFRAAQASHQAAASVQNLYQRSGASFEGGAVKIGIASPIDGVLDRAFAASGARVTADEPVFSVINTSVALVQAHVPETRLREITPQSAATFIPSGHETNRVPMKLLAIGRELDPGARTIPLTYEFTAPDQISPLGASGTLHAATTQSVDAISIPANAIVEEEGVPVVFVQLSGETFEKRDVALGIRDGDWIEVKRGVAEEERVATDGAYAILLSTKSGAIPAHGHAH